MLIAPDMATHLRLAEVDAGNARSVLSVCDWASFFAMRYNAIIMSTGEASRRHLSTTHPPFDLSFLDTRDDFFSFYVIGSFLCVLFASIAAGLTMGFMGVDPLKMKIILKTGSPADKKAVAKIMPVLTDHHRLLSTLLLFNSLANEALPVFLDALVPAWIAVILSVTAVFGVGEVLPNAIFTGKHRLILTAKCVPFMNCLLLIFYPVAKPLGM